MNMLYLKEILNTIKEERKIITQQVKSEMVKSSENFNSTMQGLIDFIGQKNTIEEKDNIVNLQNEVLDIINEINMTKIKSFKDCKNIIRLRTRFNYLINKFKNVIKDIDIPQELSDEFNLSLGMYRKSISEYLRVIKRQKNIQYIQLSVNLKKLTPEVETELIKVIRNEKRFNKNWNNAKNPKSNDCQIESSTTVDVIKILDQFKPYSSSLSRLSEYLEEVNIKESVTVIKSQTAIVELITEMTKTEVNNDADYDKINKLRDKFNYQVRKIKNVIKDIDIPKELSDEYALSLTLFRKSMSNYLKDVKKQNEIYAALSQNNSTLSADTESDVIKNTDDIVNDNNIEIDPVTYESIKLVDTLNLFNHDLDKLVNYLKENDIDDSSFIAECQKNIIEIVTELSNIEPNSDNETQIYNLKSRFSCQVSMMGNIFSRLDIPQSLFKESDLSISSLNSAINKYTNLNKEKEDKKLYKTEETSKDNEDKIIDKVETIESNLNNNDSVEQELNEDKNDSVACDIIDSEEKSLKEILNMLKEGLKNPQLDVIDWDTSVVEEKSALAVSYKDSTLPSLFEVLNMPEKLKLLKNMLTKIQKKPVACGLSIIILTAFLNSITSYGSDNTILSSDNYDNTNSLNISSIEDIDDEMIDECINSLVTSLEVEPENIENGLISNHTPTINKVYASKYDAIFKQNIITIPKMSYDVRERLMLTNDQLDTLLDSLCDPNGISNVVFENKDEALNFLYTRQDRISYAEKMLVVMARFNLTYDELDKSCATMTYEAGPNNYEEGHNCMDTAINRSQSIAWTWNYDSSIYAQTTRPGQFYAYLNDYYVIYLGRIDLPAYQGAIDALYEMKPNHNYLNFNKVGEGIDGVQLTEGGNEYSNELTPDQRVEMPYMEIIRQELSEYENHLHHLEIDELSEKELSKELNR